MQSLSNMKFIYLVLLVAVSAIAFSGCSDQGEPVGPITDNLPPDSLTWVADIYPNIIQSNCAICHNAQDLTAGLDLTNFDNVLNVVVPGDPENSLIVRRLEGNGVDVMPPGSRLPSDDVDLVKTWIEQGAKYE